MHGAVSDGYEEIGPLYETEVEAGSWNDTPKNSDGDNLDGREQPVERNDPDDAMSTTRHADQRDDARRRPSRIR